MANDTTIIETLADRETPTEAEVQLWVKRSMGALTRLLVGKKGDPREPAFNRHVMVIVGGQLPPAGMMWLADAARLNRKHVIHLSASPNHDIPTIAMAYRRGEMVEVYEYCMLCMAPGEDRVRIVPDTFKHGAFRFAPDMKLKRCNAPRSFDAAMGVMARAYNRFHELCADTPADDWQPLRFAMR